MSEVTLHATPRWRDVVLAQIRVTALGLRPVALVAAIVLAAGTVVIGGDLITGRPGFDSDELFPTTLIFFFFPFAVWRNDKRFAPAFLWTLPVDRRRLALAKVFAGLVWLLAALAVFAAWLLALGLLARVPLAATVLRIPFIPTIAAYLIGSALVVGLRYPLRWLLGTAGLVFLVGSVSQLFEPRFGVNTVFAFRSLPFVGEDGYRIWITLPVLARASTALLCFAAGLATLWAALSRHGERRRR